MNNRSNWKRRITKLPRKLAKPTCFANTLFYLFWTLLIVGKGFGMTANNRPMRILTWIGISLAILKMAVEKWKKNELIISMALIVAGILVYVFSQDAAVLLTVIVICGTKGIDLHFLFKYSFWIRLILFLSVSTLAIFNVIDRELLIRYDSGNVHTIRYALGYGHPNATHYHDNIVHVVIHVIVLDLARKSGISIRIAFYLESEQCIIGYHHNIGT